MRERIVPLRGRRLVECFDRAHRSDQAARFVGRHLTVPPGARVAEVGCGTGVLAFLAAQLGAAAVWAGDVEERAVELCARGARRNGLAERVACHVAPFLDGVPGHAGLDVVVSVMAQRPSPTPFAMRYAGGHDGADLL